MNVSFIKTVYLGNLAFFVTDDFNANENYYRELKNLIKIRRVNKHSFIRIGKPNDGGYIMLDNFQKGGGIAYSFGIANDVSWDYDMVQRGYEIFMYDMTINALPFQHPNFHFFKQGIGGSKNEVEALDTLENFIERNTHQNNQHMILKMDVEGAEWDFLTSVSSNTLNQFDQIVFEFHNITQPKNSAQMEKTIEAFKKLNKTHTPVHIHGNNHSSFLNIGGIGIFPNVPEITYVKNENYEFEDDDEIFLPIPLDQPNHWKLKDIPLGYWNKFTS